MMREDMYANLSNVQKKLLFYLYRYSKVMETVDSPLLKKIVVIMKLQLFLNIC